jgi:hypothetical protein
MRKEVFVASVQYGEPLLAQVALDQETEKSFLVNTETQRNLIGSLWLTQRLSKESKKYRVFFDQTKATKYLVSEMENYLKNLADRTEKARSRLKELKSTLDEGRTLKIYLAMLWKNQPWLAQIAVFGQDEEYWFLGEPASYENLVGSPPANFVFCRTGLPKTSPLYSTFGNQEEAVN